MFTLGKGLWFGLRHLIVPGVCLACHVPLPPDGNDFCTACSQQFTDDPHLTCSRCSSTVGPHTDVTAECPHCRGEGFAFDRAVRLGPYDGLLRDLILRMKQRGNEGVAEAVGECWAAKDSGRVRELAADCIIPVPLHWLRRWQRGFNQSDLLARAWEKQLGVPCLSRGLRRVRATPKQTTLSPTARRENVRGAFRVARNLNLKGRRVLLVDDVLTTGGTAHAAARALKDAGANFVAAAVLGHGH
jgi:ComF family protein